MSKHNGKQTHPLPTIKKGTRTMILIEYKYGPDPDGPTRCFVCLKPFVNSDQWQKWWDTNKEYAIGIHSNCIVKMNKQV